MSRCVSGAQLTNGTNNVFMGFALRASAPNGCLIEDVKCTAWGDINAPASGPYAALEDGTWTLAYFPLTAAFAEAPKLDVAVESSRAQFLSGLVPLADLPANPVVLGTTRRATGVVGNAYEFVLQPGLTWVVPRDQILLILSNGRPSGGTARSEVSLTWQE